MAPGIACGEPGAVCTADGRSLSAGVGLAVQGPSSASNRNAIEGTDVQVVPALPLPAAALLALLLGWGGHPGGGYSSAARSGEARLRVKICALPDRAKEVSASSFLRSAGRGPRPAITAL